MPSPGAGAPRWTRALLLALIALAAVTATAVLVTLPAGTAVPPSGFSLPWWALALGFFAAEMLVFPLPVRSETHPVSFSEIPLVVGLALSGPVGLVVGRLAGSTAALAAVRRQRPLKLAFNVTLLYLETALALAAFRFILAGAAPAGPRGWIAAVAAVEVAQVTGSALVTAAIAIEHRALHLPAVARGFAFGSAFALASGLGGIVAVAILWRDPPAALPALGLAALLYWALRRFASLRRRHDELTAVYSFTQVVAAANTLEESTRVILQHLRDRFRAGLSALVAPDPGSGEVSLAVLDEQGGLNLRRGDPAAAEALRHLVGPASGGTLDLTGEARDAACRLFARDLASGIYAAVGSTGAALLVAECPTSQPIDGHERRLFAALARHSEAILERGRSIAQLRQNIATREHQAMHDSLTGLPNREAFGEATRRAVALVGGDSPAVLLLDLDRFQDVNDTLGHHEGDRLLVDVGERVRGVLRPGDRLARVGGDEFAVLVQVGSIADAVGIARRIEDALRPPFHRAGITIEVSGSIGIALGAGSASHVELMQQADIAMYVAKALGSGYEVYSPDLNHYSPARLALAGELRPALAGGEVLVHYQPKVRVADGMVVGVEALARWVHPSRGPVPPGEFIPIAERTGLIKPLTQHVLRVALQDLAGWTAAGLGLSVAVNVSPRALADRDFVTTVQDLLAAADVDPRSLVLEITEESLVGGWGSVTGTLERLDALGIDVAIDDFGTGHSSLSRLRDLPIREVKIDRSFVQAMESDPQSAAIVESTISLAGKLGLRVVAEGVETDGTLAALDRLDCHVAQGFLFSPALPSSRLASWIDEHQAGLRRAQMRVTGGRAAGRTG